MSKITKIILLGLVTAGLAVTIYIVSVDGQKYVVNVYTDVDTVGREVPCEVSVIENAQGAAVGCDIGSSCSGGPLSVNFPAGASSPSQGCSDAQCVADNCASMSNSAAQTGEFSGITENEKKDSSQFKIKYNNFTK